MSKPTKRDRAALAALRELYSKVPKLDCQGFCQASCGPIPFADIERVAMERELGHPLPEVMTNPGIIAAVEIPTCPLLKDGKCSVYASRPLICRLWGNVNHELMQCPWGCQPKRLMPDRESRALIKKLEAIDDRWQSEQ